MSIFYELSWLQSCRKDPKVSSRIDKRPKLLILFIWGKVWYRLDLNPWSSCLCLPSAGFAGVHYDALLRAPDLSCIVDVISFSCIWLCLSLKRGRSSGWEADGDMVTSLVLSGNPSTTGRKKVEREGRQEKKAPYSAVEDRDRQKTRNCGFVCF